jgi:hypothetical protein
VDAVEEWRGEDYQDRRITGITSTKPNRCPGCDQLIRPVTPHVVAWPVSDPEAGERRHWHTACWRARDRRGANGQLSRSGPRY